MVHISIYASAFAKLKAQSDIVLIPSFSISDMSSLKSLYDHQVSSTAKHVPLNKSGFNANGSGYNLGGSICHFTNYGFGSDFTVHTNMASF